MIKAVTRSTEMAALARKEGMPGAIMCTTAPMLAMSAPMFSVMAGKLSTRIRVVTHFG
jgi:hypothetical protein